jgi:hypothetical protein
VWFNFEVYASDSEAAATDMPRLLAPHTCFRHSHSVGSTVAPLRLCEASRGLVAVVPAPVSAMQKTIPKLDSDLLVGEEVPFSNESSATQTSLRCPASISELLKHKPANEGLPIHFGIARILGRWEV